MNPKQMILRIFYGFCRCLPVKKKTVLLFLRKNSHRMQYGLNRFHTVYPSFQAAVLPVFELLF